MNARRIRILLGALLLLSAVAAGCRRGAAPTASPEPTVIPVSYPVRREVTDFVDYTGRTAAINAVDIKARATGYLTKAPFKEGAEVKKGDLLFEIDPRPYQTGLTWAKGQVKLAQARVRLATADYARARKVAANVAGGVSEQELETYAATEAEAQASVQAAEATLENYKLSLSFTRVTSPIDGQVSRYYYTVGNLVTQDQTLLTTVVSIDPIYAYFDVEERTVLRVRRAINEGKIKVPADTTAIPVLMGLEGEAGYPHKGTLNFVNNAVNPATGTVAVRGIFDNPKPEGGRRLLMPGMFVRIRLPIGQPHPALLVIDRAVGSDQGLKFVYVVGPDDKVEYRRVTTGALQDDGLRVIEKGVEANDRIVVGSLQRVRPRMTVEPEETAMPTMDQPVAAGDAGKPQPPPPGEKKR